MKQVIFCTYVPHAPNTADPVIQRQELYYGGWVAPNIYYTGHSGVINFAGLRIAGLSGALT